MSHRLLTVCFFMFSACRTFQPSVSGTSKLRAQAEITPLLGATANGTVAFTEQAAGIRITGKIEGLPRLSQHGFHVHEKGDCSAPDGSSAGPHFNPAKTEHGAPQNGHAGDLGNIMADNNGIAEIDIFKPGVSLASSDTTFVGHSLIIHAQVDDMQSQPAGAAGARIACGVITEVKAINAP
jgi:superoxide dismutase, Cu-Zn family